MPSVSRERKIKGKRDQSKFDPTRRHPPASAEKVLETALRLFTQHGYSGTTIEDIKLQSEVSVGVIYHHFGSKEGIAGALYVQSLCSFQRGLVDALSRRQEGAEGSVRAAVGHHLRWIDDNRTRAAFLMRRRETEVLDVNRSDVTLLNLRLFEDVERWYRPRVDRGEIRDLPLPLLCAVWFGPAQEYARAMFDGPAPQRDATLADAEPILADAAWAALRP
jgi:AcrR family transcriptional regulator